jgi:hypothetical protein
MPAMKGTSSITFMPIAPPSTDQAGSALVCTSISHFALRPSSVIRPKWGALPRMLHSISMPPELRFERDPSTELE